MTHKEALEQGIEDKDLLAKVLAYTPEYILDSEYNASSIGRAISQSFAWSRTTEGCEWWGKKAQTLGFILDDSIS